jgi:hypothetical protein
VRELENIRTFITSSALTLVIDSFLYRGVSGCDGHLSGGPDRGRDRSLPLLTF